MEKTETRKLAEEYLRLGGTRQVISETVGREQPLDVLLVGRGRGVELLDHGLADDLLLNC